MIFSYAVKYEFHQAQSSLAADAYDRAERVLPAGAGTRSKLCRGRRGARVAIDYRDTGSSLLWRPAELEEVKSLIDRALALAPNSPEAHFALGLFFYWGHRQYENALAEFNRTLELQPNNADARTYCAWVYRRRGEWSARWPILNEQRNSTLARQNPGQYWSDLQCIASVEGCGASRIAGSRHRSAQYAGSDILARHSPQRDGRCRLGPATTR